MVDGEKERSSNGEMSRPNSVDRRVGRRIKMRRLLLEIELHHLAGDLGILASALARIEAGDERPAPALLARIASYLGVNVNWFFRELEIGAAGAPAEMQQDAKPAAALPFAQRDVGSEMFELLDQFLQADAADRQAILDYARHRLKQR